MTMIGTKRVILSTFLRRFDSKVGVMSEDFRGDLTRIGGTLGRERAVGPWRDLLDHLGPWAGLGWGFAKQIPPGPEPGRLLWESLWGFHCADRDQAKPMLNILIAAFVSRFQCRLYCTFLTLPSELCHGLSCALSKTAFLTFLTFCFVWKTDSIFE